MAGRRLASAGCAVVVITGFVGRQSHSGQPEDGDRRPRRAAAGGLMAAALGGGGAAIAAGVIGGGLLGGFLGNMLDEKDKTG